MKKTVTRIFSVILVLTLLFSLTSCGEKGKIRGTINSFQKACNALDVEGVVDCLEPTVASILKAGAGLLGGLLGDSNEEVFNKLSSLLGEHSGMVGIESFKTLKIKVNDITVDEDGSSAKAQVTLNFIGLTGEEKTLAATLKLTNASDRWLLSGIDF